MYKKYLAYSYVQASITFTATYIHFDMNTSSQFTKTYENMKNCFYQFSLSSFPWRVCIFIMILIIYPTTYTARRIFSVFLFWWKLQCCWMCTYCFKKRVSSNTQNHRGGWFMLAVIIISCPHIIYHVILKFSQTEFTTKEFHTHFSQEYDKRN